MAGKAAAVPDGLGLGVQVEHEQVALVKGANHLQARVFAPGLNYPHGIRVVGFHGLHYRLSGTREVDALGAPALVERVHAVVARDAVQLVQLVIVDGGDACKVIALGLQEGRALVAEPLAGVLDVDAQRLGGIVGQHTGISGEHRLHAQRTHTCHNLLLQKLLPLVVRRRYRSAPAFEVVHQPPGLEARAGDVLVDFVGGVAQAQQHVAPYRLGARYGQGHVYAVQGHPVDLLLPTVPVPEGHRVGVGAVVEVVAQVGRAVVALGRLWHGQTVAHRGVHIAPAQVHARVVFEVVVDADGGAEVVAGGDEGPPVLFAQTEPVATGRAALDGCRRRVHLDQDFLRETLVDTFQQRVDGRGGASPGRDGDKAEPRRHQFFHYRHRYKILQGKDIQNTEDGQGGRYRYRSSSTDNSLTCAQFCGRGHISRRRGLVCRGFCVIL